MKIQLKIGAQKNCDKIDLEQIRSAINKEQEKKLEKQIKIVKPINQKKIIMNIVQQKELDKINQEKQKELDKINEENNQLEEIRYRINKEQEIRKLKIEIEKQQREEQIKYMNKKKEEEEREKEQRIVQKNKERNEEKLKLKEKTQKEKEESVEQKKKEQEEKKKEREEKEKQKKKEREEKIIKEREEKEEQKKQERERIEREENEIKEREEKDREKEEGGIAYVIGKSSLEEMDASIEREYETGYRVIVSKKQTSTRNKAMERYASLLAIYSMKRFEKGKLQLSPDCCKSDLIFSREDTPELFLGIQVKTTSNFKTTIRKYDTTKFWKFSDTDKDYSGFLMYLRSLNDGKSWLIPYNILHQYYKGSSLSIQSNPKLNLTTMNWNDYKVDDRNIAQKIHEYYDLALQSDNVLTLISNEDITKPISECVQKEHNARKIIIPILEKTGLIVSDPKLENMTYDLIFGEIKIQEKLSYLKKNLTYYNIHLSRGSNKPYRQNDFDILLIHNPAPFDRTFYFIPMDKLMEHNYIKKDDTGNETLLLYPGELENREEINKLKNNWSIEFLCYYDDPNLIKRILEIYNMQLNHYNNSIIINNPIHWEMECNNFNDLVTKWNFKRSFAVVGQEYTFILNEKRVSEKTITKSYDSYILYLRNYSKNESKKIVYSPLEYGGFDFIYSKIPETKTFCLIPSSEILKRGFLKNQQEIGKKSLSFPFLDAINKNIQNRHSWIVNFVFYFNDPNIKEKILKLFEDYPR